MNFKNSKEKTNNSKENSKDSGEISRNYKGKRPIQGYKKNHTNPEQPSKHKYGQERVKTFESPLSLIPNQKLNDLRKLLDEDLISDLKTTGLNLNFQKKLVEKQKGALNALKELTSKMDQNQAQYYLNIGAQSGLQSQIETNEEWLQECSKFGLIDSNGETSIPSPQIIKVFEKKMEEGNKYQKHINLFIKAYDEKRNNMGLSKEEIEFENLILKAIVKKESLIKTYGYDFIKKIENDYQYRLGPDTCNKIGSLGMYVNGKFESMVEKAKEGMEMKKLLQETRKQKNF